MSVREALIHAGVSQAWMCILIGSILKTWNAAWLERLEKSAGIVVPGGFGYRGIEGKIIAARFAREHKIPYLVSV